jgi:hypothetical protein
LIKTNAKIYGKRAQNFHNFASQKSFSVHFKGSKITAGSTGATCHFSSRLAADVKGLISRLARLADTSAKLSSDSEILTEILNFHFYAILFGSHINP